MTEPTQYKRFAQLIAVGAGGEGLDLSNFRIRFSIHNASMESPNHAEIRVYNLSDHTARALVSGGYQFIILNAGYEQGNVGTVFKGSIMQTRKGRESNLDTYVDLLCSDGDIGYNDSLVKSNVGKGADLESQLTPIFTAMSSLTMGKSVDDMRAQAPNVMSLRGKVLFGYARARLRNLLTTLGYSWSIQGGEIKVVPFNGYPPGQVIDLNTGSGLVGTPEQTEAGVSAMSLMNPHLQVGSLIRLPLEAINQTNLQSIVDYSSWAGIKKNTPLTPANTYMALVVEHEGDTRGSQWYTNLTMVGVDLTSGQAVDTIGGRP